jgi:starvation-inducible DNA-binding protein
MATLDAPISADGTRVDLMKTNERTTHRTGQKLHPTRNDLAEAARAELCELLNSRLASGLDLYLQAKQAHWNVKGPNFLQLHELFDGVATALIPGNDEIAERIAQLGGVARGTAQVISADSGLRPYPLAIFAGPDHVEALANALAAYAALLRAAIDHSARIGDADTADLFTGISREVDKQLWFVEAHQQAQA